MTSVPLRTRLVDAIFRRAFWIALGLWAGCAHSPGPRVVEFPVGDYVFDPFADEAPSVLSVVSDEPCPVRVVVACANSAGGEDAFSVDAAPRGTTSVIFQKLAINYAVNMCHRKSWVCR